jgi:Clp amino terminal domain, pathogenicity island component
MFERYTEKARRAIFFARYAASQYGSPYIESEHLLLGLLREDRAPASYIESIRREIESGYDSRAHLNFCGSSAETGVQAHQARCYQPGKREDGLGVIYVFSTKIGIRFHLEYRRPDRSPSDPIAADGINLKFCPWCGRNLANWYASGLPPFDPATSQRSRIGPDLMGFGPSQNKSVPLLDANYSRRLVGSLWLPIALDAIFCHHDAIHVSEDCDSGLCECVRRHDHR